VPLRCNTAKEVSGDFVDIRAIIGLVEEIRWYRKGMPRMARRKGSKMDNVDCACLHISNFLRALVLFKALLTFSDFPLTPTNVPLLVYNFCDADKETDKSEYGAPRTSNLASAHPVLSAKLLCMNYDESNYLQSPSKHQLNYSEHLQ